MRDDRVKILDIIDSICAIEKYAVKGKAEFEKEELIQVWIVHHLMIIGEAAGKISQATRENCSVIPWQRIIAMRNILVHQYFGIDIEEIWNTVEKDIPELKYNIEAMLKHIK